MRIAIRKLGHSRHKLAVELALHLLDEGLHLLAQLLDFGQVDFRTGAALALAHPVNTDRMAREPEGGGNVSANVDGGLHTDDFVYDARHARFREAGSIDHAPPSGHPVLAPLRQEEGAAWVGGTWRNGVVVVDGRQHGGQIDLPAREISIRDPLRIKDVGITQVRRHDRELVDAQDGLVLRTNEVVGVDGRAIEGEALVTLHREDVDANERFQLGDGAQDVFLQVVVIFDVVALGARIDDWGNQRDAKKESLLQLLGSQKRFNPAPVLTIDRVLRKDGARIDGAIVVICHLAPTAVVEHVEGMIHKAIGDL